MLVAGRSRAEKVVRDQLPTGQEMHGRTSCIAITERGYMEGTSTRRLLFVKDLRQMFPGLGSDAVYALLTNREIPASKVGGKWVTTPEAVEGWLQRISSFGGDQSPLKVVR